MLSKKIEQLKFKFMVFKVKCSYMKHVMHCLKTIKFCTHYMDKICIPANEKETVIMKRLLSVYDEAINSLNECVNIYRKRVK